MGSSVFTQSELPDHQPLSLSKQSYQRWGTAGCSALRLLLSDAAVLPGGPRCKSPSTNTKTRGTPEGKRLAACLQLLCVSGSRQAAKKAGGEGVRLVGIAVQGSRCNHLLLHILQSRRDYVLITRSSASKAVLLRGGHWHLKKSMENMCLASEVNNVLVIFPGTGEASGNLRRSLTTKVHEGTARGGGAQLIVSFPQC